MRARYAYIAAAILTVILRFVLNFSSTLIPGINGGYYPVQVRSIMNTGHLGFPDMPLYFYLNVLFVKISSLFTGADVGWLIIIVSKIIDSISLPLLLIPLFLIVKNIFDNRVPKYFEWIIIGFATVSFSPLILTSDFQKNSAAIPLMLFFIYYLLLFFKVKAKKYIFLSILFIILTGLTHFGVFVISIFILLVSITVFYRRKALLPIMISLGLCISLVYLFDPARVKRLLHFWSFIFDKPVILKGYLTPLDFLNYFISYLLIGMGVSLMIRLKGLENGFLKKILMIFLLVIFILSFPLLDNGYAKRLNLLLFVPQIFTLCVISIFIVNRWRNVLGSMLVLITVVSVPLMLLNNKPVSITMEAFRDLKNLKKYIHGNDKTLIIARHGLEWWVAWQLHTKVGQDKALLRVADSEFDRIMILVQLHGNNRIYSNQKSPFHEPSTPAIRGPFYHSHYFAAFELKTEDLNRIKSRGKPTRLKKP
jgi:hypothetical protein